MDNEYKRFISRKASTFTPSGFDCKDLPGSLFDYQRDIVRWACRMGKCGVFADTGLGKTAMQMAWADQVASHTGQPVIVLAPLCVAQQTVREAAKFGIDAEYLREPADRKIIVTNYERMAKFDAASFSGVVLDESSILKSHTSRTRKELIDRFQSTLYRLSCTATPSPNDYMELGNQAEFLGQMTQSEMLAMYFIHDGGSTQNWRLKGHAQKKFWEWLASFAVFMGSPSDLGYDGSMHVLPELRYIEHSIGAGFYAHGELFPKPVSTLSERRDIKRQTINDRVGRCAEIVNASSEPWIVWCDLNDESSAASVAIPDSVEVTGSMDAEEKESRIMDFTDGNARVIVTKTSIAGFGMNWQHCRNMAFLGVNDSYESLYQAVRRCWRFGQDRVVNVHMFYAEEEQTVLTNLRRKAQQHDEMSTAMRAIVSDVCASNLTRQRANKTDYAPEIKMEIPVWLAS